MNVVLVGWVRSEQKVVISRRVCSEQKAEVQYVLWWEDEKGGGLWRYGHRKVVHDVQFVNNWR